MQNPTPCGVVVLFPWQRERSDMMFFQKPYLQLTA